jgi:ribonucleoside-diphosphate reductase alpha chain
MDQVFRVRLPATRQGIVHKFVILAQGQRVKCFLTVGLYPDGRPGEIFMTVKAADPAVNGLAGAWATCFSLCLQSGIPIEHLANKFAYWRFEPGGFVEPNDTGIHTAASIVDYVARFLLHRFATGVDYSATTDRADVQPPPLRELSAPVALVSTNETSNNQPKE